MRHIIIYIILFIPTVLTAQISSESSYFLSNDIDTLLNQLQKNKFKNLKIKIENKHASKEYRKETYSYDRLNDTLIKVTTKEFTQQYYYDFKSKRYQYFDSLKPPNYLPDSYRCEKDSANYKVIYSCGLKGEDAIFGFYIRMKNDSQGRMTYHYSAGRHLKNPEELEYKYLSDTTIFTKNSILQSGQKVLLYADTTISHTSVVENTKIIKQTIKSQNKYFNTDGYVFTTITLTKTLKYDKNENLIGIDYMECGSDGRKEKATMKVIYESN